MNTLYSEYDRVLSDLETDIADRDSGSLSPRVNELLGLLTVPNVVQGMLQLPSSKMGTEAILLILADAGQSLLIDPDSTQPTPYQTSIAEQQLKEGFGGTTLLQLQPYNRSSAYMNPDAAGFTTFVQYGIQDTGGWRLKGRPSIAINMPAMQEDPVYWNPTIVHETVHAASAINRPVVKPLSVEASQAMGFIEEYDAYSAERIFYTVGHFPSEDINYYVAHILDTLAEDLQLEKGTDPVDPIEIQRAAENICMDVTSISDENPTDEQIEQVEQYIQRIHAKHKWRK